MSENKDVEVLEMKELVIRSRRRRFSLGVDGELIRHRGTLRFQIHPQKLNVIVKNHSGSDLTTDA
jgi:diacylglycerol kinase family enzyme